MNWRRSMTRFVFFLIQFFSICIFSRNKYRFNLCKSYNTEVIIYAPAAGFIVIKITGIRSGEIFSLFNKWPTAENNFRPIFRYRGSRRCNLFHVSVTFSRGWFYSFLVNWCRTWFSIVDRVRVLWFLHELASVRVDSMVYV